MDGHTIITGGGTGLGHAAAEALAPTHALSLIGRRQAVVDAAAAHLPRAVGLSADVTDEPALAHAFATAKTQNGPVTGLVAAAGIAATAPLERTDTAFLRRLLAVNVEGVLATIRLALPDMLAAGNGRIVVIASTASLKGYAYAGAYAASKHAVLGLVRSLALEMATKGITVNAVCPGFADTEMTAKSIQNIVESTGRSESDARNVLAKTNPMGRLVAPSEVGDAVRWLFGPGASSITGQAIAVAGGEVM
ncbi:MAG: SDR family oxidoreductase [Pseudomonadota bacterium]